MRIPRYFLGITALLTVLASGHASTTSRFIAMAPSNAVVGDLVGLSEERLATLEDVSVLMRARASGLLSATRIDPVLESRLRVLASQQRLNSTLSLEAWQLNIVVQDEIVGKGLREILASGTLDPQAPLFGAASDWLSAIAQGGMPQVSSLEPAPPSSNCFTTYIACVAWCSMLPTFVERAACGLDCANDLRNCIRQSERRPIGDDPVALTLQRIGN